MSLHRLGLALLLCAFAFSAQTITRVEQNDPSVTYSGNWFTNNSSANSGGLAALTNGINDIAAITFTGTGITWIGVRDPGNGLAWVNLDGTTALVDTYGSATLYQQPLFSVHGLTPGQHALFINVLGIPSPQGRDFWVWVDAFDIENGSAITGGTSAAGSRINLDFSAILASGGWPVSAGKPLDSSSTGSLKVFFNGTSIVWITSFTTISGIANVYVDDVLKATVDTYSTSSTVQDNPSGYGIGGLGPGPHTMTIATTGNKNPASTSAEIFVRGFQITGTPMYAGPPVVNAGGVVNGASFQPAPNNQVAPGQIISVFGQRFFMSGRADAGTVPLPTKLGPDNTTVTICNQSAPLFAAFPVQINVQLPWECPQGGTAPLTVSVNGQTSASENVMLAPSAPGIFIVTDPTTDQFPQRVAAALHADYSPVTSINPSRVGETILIYATGLGPVDPPVATGMSASGIHMTTLPVTVSMGNQNAPVQFSGLAPGFVGLYQVNVTVPAITGFTHVNPPMTVITSGSASSAGAIVP